MSSPYLYSPSGLSAVFTPIPEIGDIEVVVKDDDIHLFHLILPNHDIIAHAVSRDGLVWEELPDALHTGTPGSYDDDMLWTPSIKRYKGRYCMVYPALSKADHGKIPRTSLATSEDLIRWEKFPDNPIGEADPRWYDTDLTTGQVSWRDPYLCIEQETAYILVCARERKDVPFLRRGCVGLMSSSDGAHWNVEAPLYAPGHYIDWEVPVLVVLNERYYLLGGIRETGRCHYRIADRFRGPYHTPSNDAILPRGNYANRVCRWKDKHLMFSWLRPHDTEDFPGRLLAPPKEIVIESDSTLGLRSFEGWTEKCKEREFAMSTRELLHKGKSVKGKWEARGQEILCHSVNEMSTLLLDQEEDNFILDVTVRIERGVAAGLVFRSPNDGFGQGMILRVSLADNEIQLLRWGKQEIRSAWQDRHEILYKRHILQSERIFIRPEDHCRLHLIASHEYIEASVNDRVKISTISWDLRKGRTGVFTEYGVASFGDVSLRRL
jgi:beta-fructofuranosidase